MKSTEFKNWSEFKTYLGSYAALRIERKNQIIFRGQSNSKWILETTLDRLHPFSIDSVRQQYLKELLTQFRKCSLGITGTVDSMPCWSPDDSESMMQWELLARHHGVPTTVLDWTQSPWISAYFAYSDPVSKESDNSCIYCLDREVFAQFLLDEIELIDDMELLAKNARAIEQDSLFMKVNVLSANITEYFKGHIYRFLLPSKDRSLALSDLDDMGINHRNLFRDLDGAARTATLRGFKYDI